MDSAFEFEGAAIEIVGISVSLLVGAVLAALASALNSLGLPRLKAMAETEGPYARTAARAERDYPVIQARLLAARVLCVSIAAVFGARLLVLWAGYTHVAPFFAEVAVVAMAYSVLAEVASAFAVARASQVAMPMLRWLRPFEWVVAPLAAPLTWLTRLVGRRVRNSEPPSEEVTRLAVEHIITEGEDTGSIASDDADLLRSVLEFRDTVTREVMVPRTQMVAVDIQTPLSEVKALVAAEGHSRYPVYRDKIDQVEGILYVKDLLQTMSQTGAATSLGLIIRRPVFYAAETQKIGALLREMQARRVHLAIVVDEYGGTSGIVTLEDIMEEIVGEIDDEHDDGRERVRQIAPGRYIADAGISVYDLEEFLGERFPQGEYDSLGGLVVEVAGRVPAPGEGVGIGPFHLTVRKSDDRRVVQVEIVRKPDPAPESSESAA